MLFNKLLRNCEKLVDEMQLEHLKDIGLERTLETYHLVGPYPPLMQMQEYNLENSFEDADEKNIGLVNLYIHFPYCRVVGKDECSFCFFYKEKYDPGSERELVDSWIKELKRYRKIFGDFKVNTIYFGGGTVSLITPKNLRLFVDYLVQEIGMEQCLEVKFEIHADSSKEPGKLNEILDVLKVFNNLKIVIDIQSLNPLTLKYVTWDRVSSDVYFRTLDAIISKGYNNICTGLILGLPFETPETFLEGVSKLITIPEMEMLNIYPLMFRECDHVYRCIQHSPEIMLDVKTRDVVHLATRKLLRSFNFTESPLYFYSRGTSEPVQQRKKYESENSLIGIGPSAFGHINSSGVNIAYYNLHSIVGHAERLNKQKLPIWKIGDLNEDSKQIRKAIKGKNMLKEFAIDMDAVSGNIKDKLETTLNIFQLHGLLEKKSDGFLLTEKGILRAEEMSYYLAETDLGKRLTESTREIFPLNCFPSRTEEQLLRWKAECNNVRKI